VKISQRRIEEWLIREGFAVRIGDALEPTKLGLYVAVALRGEALP
jgi:hypothetical protein